MITVGKEGIVRCTGPDMEALRIEVYARDDGKCQRCGRQTWMHLPHECVDAFHLAHRRSKRMWGDTPENTQTECGDCHRTYHQRGPTMEKVCPAKV